LIQRRGRRDSQPVRRTARLFQWVTHTGFPSASLLTTPKHLGRSVSTAPGRSLGTRGGLGDDQCYAWRR
jgi:hypothetical protein